MLRHNQGSHWFADLCKTDTTYLWETGVGSATSNSAEINFGGKYIWKGQRKCGWRLGHEWLNAGPKAREVYFVGNLEIVEQNKQAKKFAPRLDSSVVTSWNGVGHSRKNEETSAHNDVATKLAFSANIHRNCPPKKLKHLRNHNVDIERDLSHQHVLAGARADSELKKRKKIRVKGREDMLTYHMRDPAVEIILRNRSAVLTTKLVAKVVGEA
ncbi:hypothetical protein C8J57DRAFT_1229969 [Mycena rebaudengoi]|nr:hypothetical protein C8J57DRAFT_1229969 [Mycena rebaudengoi]